MSTTLAKVSLLLLSAIIFLLVILFQFLPFCIYKTDDAGGYVLCVSTSKTIPQISSDHMDEVSGSHKSYSDQKNNLPPDIGEIDVVKLTVKNFSHVISNNQHVMVAFVAPWCYWSKKLAPEFAAAATELKGKVVLAEVNAYTEIELQKKCGIQGYPTIYFFVNGVHVDTYYHDRTRDAIVNWIKTKQAGAVYTLMGTEEAENLLAAESTIALGFLSSLEAMESKELAAASKLHPEVLFFQTTSADVAKMFQIDPETRIPALVLLEKESRNIIHFDGQFSRSAVADFICSNKFPCVVTYTWKNAPLIFNQFVVSYRFSRNCMIPSLEQYFKREVKLSKQCCSLCMPKWTAKVGDTTPNTLVSLVMFQNRAMSQVDHVHRVKHGRRTA